MFACRLEGKKSSQVLNQGLDLEYIEKYNQDLFRRPGRLMVNSFSDRGID
jgi:hypothetical protein